jgi:hypothetical protein
VARMPDASPGPEREQTASESPVALPISLSANASSFEMASRRHRAETTRGHVSATR